MAFAWLRRKLAEIDIASAKNDLERYVEDLRGMNDAQVGGLLAVATVLRTNIEKDGVLPPGLFDRETTEADNEMAAYLWRLNKAVVDFRKKGRGFDAAAMLLWVHTLRGLIHPDFRDLGRAMWGEMARGLNEMDAAWKAVEERADCVIADDVKEKQTFVPKGLKPDLQALSQIESRAEES